MDVAVDDGHAVTSMRASARLDDFQRWRFTTMAGSVQVAQRRMPIRRGTNGSRVIGQDEACRAATRRAFAPFATCIGGARPPTRSGIE